MTTAKENNITYQDTYVSIPYVTLENNVWTYNIDTGIYPFPDDDFQIAFQTMTEDQLQSKGTSRHILSLNGASTGTIDQQDDYCRFTTVNGTYSDFHVGYNSTCVVTQTPLGLFYRNVNITERRMSVSLAPPAGYQIFCVGGHALTAYTFYGKIFWLKIKRNEEMIADFRPMYDGSKAYFANTLGNQKITSSTMRYGMTIVKSADLKGVEL